MTPQRQASMRLAERGKAMLDAGDPDRAAAVCMDAVGVDATNGVAYFYLAVANEQLGKREIASGLLDKAEALLGADEEWQGKINELRTRMGEPVSPITLPSPIDREF